MSGQIKIPHSQWYFWIFLISYTWGQDSTFSYFNEEDIPIYSDSSSLDSAAIPKPKEQNRKNSIQVRGEKFVEVNSSNGSSFNQGLLLDIQGNISDSTTVTGHLSDQQNDLANGNSSATLREFDQLRLSFVNPNWFMTLGDFSVQHSAGERGVWSQWIRGVELGWTPSFGKSHFSAGVTPSEFKRQRFQALSGQQGGYFIGDQDQLEPIQPGSVTLWLDGEKLQEGLDYEVDYFEALINFSAERLIQAQQWVEIEYQTISEEYAQNFIAASQSIHIDWLDVSAWSYHADYDNDSNRVSHTWSGISENVRILPMLWQRVELEEVDYGGEKTHRGSIELYDGVSIGDHSKGLGYSFKYLEKDSSFLDLNQSYDEGSKWIEWRLPFSTQSWEEQTIDYQFRVNPSKYWYQSISYNTIELIKADSLIRGDKWTYHTSHNYGIFNQETQYHDLQLEGDTEYHEKLFQTKPSLNLGKWTPSIELLGIDRESNVHIHESKLQPSLNFRDTLYTGEFEQDLHFLNRRIRYMNSNDSLFVLGGGISQRYQQVDGLNINHQSHYQVEREEDLQERDVWLSQVAAQFWRNNMPLQGEFQYELENTQGKFRVPIYQRVPEGSGNVAFDSITNSYIQNVERGNFILQGWVNDTTQSYQMQRRALYSLHLKSQLKDVFSIKNGLLAYSDVGWMSQMSTIDTANTLGLWPSVSTSTYRSFYEANQQQDVYYRVDNGKHNFEWWRSWFHQSSGGINLVEEKELEDRFTLDLRVLSNLQFQPLLELTRHDLFEFGKWNRNTYRLQFDIEWPLNIHHKPFFQIARGQYTIRSNDVESDMVQTGVVWAYQHLKWGMAELELSAVQLSNDEAPFALTDGYISGTSWRVKQVLNLKLSQNFFMDFHYLALLHEENTFQRLSLQSRAVF